MFPLLRIGLITSVATLCRARLATEKRGAGGGLRSGAPPPSTDSPQNGTDNLREEIRHALSSALGDGHGVEQGHLDIVRNKLSHTWESLPKNSFGLVARRSMRYAVHRYFLQTYHISVIGLEATSEGESNTESALLMRFVPNYVRNVFNEKSTSGFSLADAVALIAVLEQLILDSASTLLETVYKVYNVDPRALLPLRVVADIVKEYTLHWTTGQTDERAVMEVHESMADTEEWNHESLEHIASLSLGAVQGFVFERKENPRRYYSDEWDSGGAWNPLFPEFSFTDVQTIVSGIIHTFGNFWAPSCDRMKQALVSIDTWQTGRVQLTDFHSASTGGQWEFAESADYLRQLGALDETRGSRVIITNYMQATSNCVVLAPHYRVCCANECEDHMDELETIVGAPHAAPELLLSAVENISEAWYGDEDLVDHEDMDEEGEWIDHSEPSVGNKKPELPDELRAQLHKISLVQGGKVPLHGRLFAQWLHYAFPHECPYPHRSGTINPMTPEEFGESYKASPEEIEKHYQDEIEMLDSESESLEDETEYMNQWDHEEELLAEHVGLKAPWEKSQSRRTVWVMLAVMGFFVFASLYSCLLSYSDAPSQKIEKIESHAPTLSY